MGTGRAGRPPGTFHMSLPNLVGDWQGGTFTPHWVPHLSDVFRWPTRILTQDTSPITSSDSFVLSGWYWSGPMVGLLNASDDGIFVQLSFAPDRALGYPIDTLIIIDAQFLADSPIVYFTGEAPQPPIIPVGDLHRHEVLGYEQIKGTMLAVSNQGAEFGGWEMARPQNIIFRRRVPPHQVITEGPQRRMP
jgi:hypothetical protein